MRSAVELPMSAALAITFELRRSRQLGSFVTCLTDWSGFRLGLYGVYWALLCLLFEFSANNAYRDLEDTYQQSSWGSQPCSSSTMWRDRTNLYLSTLLKLHDLCELLLMSVLSQLHILPPVIHTPPREETALHRSF
jgi:hypothetical protein